MKISWSVRKFISCRNGACVSFNYGIFIGNHKWPVSGGFNECEMQNGCETAVFRLEPKGPRQPAGHCTSSNECFPHEVCYWWKCRRITTGPNNVTGDVYRSCISEL